MKTFGLSRLPCFLVILCLSACSIRIPVNLPTDNLETGSDVLLIQKWGATKSTTFALSRTVYKTPQRKRALREICAISDLGLQHYREGKIDRKKYDAIQKEAIYCVQNAVHRMHGEDGAEVNGPDPILDYLKTEIDTLKKLLNQ